MALPLRHGDIEVLRDRAEELKTGNLKTMQFHQLTQFHHKPAVINPNLTNVNPFLTIYQQSRG